jgi:hypothetical protein
MKRKEKKVSWHETRRRIWHAHHAGDGTSVCGLVSYERPPGPGRDEPGGHACIHCRAWLRRAKEDAVKEEEERALRKAEILKPLVARLPSKGTRAKEGHLMGSEDHRDGAGEGTREEGHDLGMVLDRLRELQQTEPQLRWFVLGVCLPTGEP